MRIEIDQSGKVEDTSRKTVIGLVSKKKYSVVISSKEKRKLQEYFRRIGKPRIFVDFVFSALVYLVIKYSENLKNKIYIDKEYSGHDVTIERMIGLLAGKDLSMEWTSVGKTGVSHDYAYKVFVGKAKANRVVKARDILEIINKKTGGYLNSRLKLENRYSDPVIEMIVSKNGGKVKK